MWQRGLSDVQPISVIDVNGIGRSIIHSAGSAGHPWELGLVWSASRRIVRVLLIMLLVGVLIVRYAVRQFSRKELIYPPRPGC
jgi:hypothetical protein